MNVSKKFKSNKNTKFYRTSTPVSKQLSSTTLPSFEHLSSIGKISSENKSQNSFTNYFRLKKRTKCQKPKISNSFLESSCGSIEKDSSTKKHLSMSNQSPITVAKTSKSSETPLKSLPFRTKKIFNQQQMYSKYNEHYQFSFSQQFKNSDNYFIFQNKFKTNQLNLYCKDAILEKKIGWLISSKNNRTSNIKNISVRKNLKTKHKRILLTKIKHSEFDQVKRSPLRVSERKRQIFLAKKSKTLEDANDSTKSLNHETVETNQAGQCGENIFKNLDCFDTEQTEISLKNKYNIDEISSKTYGGNLNNTKSSSERNNSECNNNQCSQILRMSLPDSVPHENAILNKKLDDICCNIGHVLENYETNKEKGNNTELENVISNSIIPDTNNPNAVVHKKDKINKSKCKIKKVDKNTNNEKNGNQRKTKAGYSSEQNVIVKQSPIPISKEEKLKLISDFKSAWEDCQCSTSLSNSHCTSTALVSKETLRNKKKDIIEIEQSSSEIVESESVVGNILSSNFQEQKVNDTVSSNGSTDIFKKPKFKRKKKTKSSRVFQNRSASLMSKPFNTECEKNLLDETFTYPYTSTPLDSPETESNAISLLFKNLSPVVEEIFPDRFTEGLIEPSILNVGYTYGKQDPSYKTSKKDQLWFSVVGSSTDCSEFNSYNQFKGDSTGSRKVKITSQSSHSETSHENLSNSNNTCKAKHTNKVKKVNSVGKNIRKTVKKSNKLEKENINGDENNKLKEQDHFEEVLKWELCVESIKKKKNATNFRKF